MNPMLTDFPANGFLNEALVIFSAMLFVIWVMPGIVQKIRPFREDR